MLNANKREPVDISVSMILNTHYSERYRLSIAVSQLVHLYDFDCLVNLLRTFDFELAIQTLAQSLTLVVRLLH